MNNYQFLIVHYRVWLREREDHKSIMQYVTTEHFVESFMDGALRAMQRSSDNVWECYKVDLVEIYAN